MATLDHIVFLARDLESGRAWMESRLGVPAQGGGDHAGMGTHNALWRLGQVYLEVLAPDPEAPPPERPRLFGLDAPETRRRLCEGPRLAAWVAATDRLDAALAAAPWLGSALPMARGDLRWRLSVAADGRPPLGGAAPALIEWPPGAHPARRMADTGLRLNRLACAVPAPEEARAKLAEIGAERLIELTEGEGPPRLSCVIAGPDGAQCFG
jgi:catechol 2,3-dioxygenase-like lactoylglutathione lyase family enzyme